MDTSSLLSRVLAPLAAALRHKLVLLLLGLAAVAGGSAIAYAIASAPSNEMSYTWSMPERIGADADGDGMIDYKDTPAYLTPTSWQATVDACAAPAVKDRPGAQLRWTFAGNGQTTPVTAKAGCKYTATLPKLGEYSVTAALDSDATVKVTAPMTLKDVFVVSVGDSVASGEGSPDTLGEKKLGPIPFYGPKWQDAQCDRSALAGPAQAAVRLEKRDPHTSVTFLHLACSGADITNGLLGPYAGQHPEIDGTKLPQKPAQLAEALRLAGWEEKDGKVVKTGRKIDDLLVSIGANNMGFADIVKSCLAVQHCQTTDDDPVLGKRAGTIYAEGIKKLAPLYKQLDQRFDEMGAKGQLGGIFQTQYYDVSQSDDGATCTGQTPQEKAGNVNGPDSSIDGFKQDEFQWTHDVVTPGINAAVKNAVDAGNASGGPKWTLVDGIANDFGKHGYCAKDRWIRQLWESLSYQRGIDGSFHPNTEGQLYGYAKNIELKVAGPAGIGGAPVPFVSPDAVNYTVDGVGKFVGFLDRADAFETVLSKIPFGGREWAQDKYQKLFQGIAWLQGKINDLSKDTSMSLTKLENTLDDIDGDGDPTKDLHIPGFPELKADLDVDISPKALTKVYEVSVSLKVTLEASGPLKFLADGLTLNGDHLTNDLGFTASAKLRIAPGEAKKVTIPADGVRIGTFSVGLHGDFSGTDDTTKPLTTKLGLASATAKGKVNGDIGVGLKFVDKDGSGVIDATQLNNPAGLFKVECVSSGADVDLSVSAGLAGVEGKLGRVTLKDPTLCDGLSAPAVELADLTQLRNLTITDVINGIAQVARTLSAAQSAGDLKLPFAKDALSKVLDVNDKLVAFFVDNGLTDPKNPLASLTFDTAKAKAIDSLETLAPALAKAVGLTPQQLGIHYEAGKLLFDLTITGGTSKPKSVSLDFGDTLNNVGVTQVKTAGSLAVGATYKVHLGFGFDLAPGLELSKRVFLTNGLDENKKPEGIFTLDASAAADVDVQAAVSVVGVHLYDENTAGGVDLLTRRDKDAPMVRVSLVDPDNDGKVTLDELAKAFQGKTMPIAAKLNAAVPATKLLASTNILGEEIGSGSLGIEWSDVSDPATLKLTADGAYKDITLPFAFDTANPRALITKVLTTTRDAVGKLRATIASGDLTTTRTLPLVGKSVADLDPVLAKLQTSVDQLIAVDDSLTLPALQAKLDAAIKKALGNANSSQKVVTLRYEPQVDGKRPAIVADLALGACTTDRTGSGCTVSNAPLDVPFNLTFGPNSKAGGLAGLDTAGQVKVSYDAKAKLSFGLTLPKVVAGDTPGSLPKLEDEKSPVSAFVRDDAAIDLGLGVKFAGKLSAGLGPIQVDLGRGDDLARAQLGVRFGIKSPNAKGERLTIGSPEFSTWLDSLVPQGENPTVHETVSANKPTCTGVSGVVDACAVLPVYSGTQKLGDIRFSAPNLLKPDFGKPGGWSIDSKDVEAQLAKQSVQFRLLVDGVRALVKQLESGLRKLPAGTNIPLVGGDPMKGADLVQAFNDRVLTKLADAADVLQGINNAKQIQAKAQELLNKIDGLKNSVTVTVKCRNGDNGFCSDTATATDVQSVEFSLPLSFGVTKTSQPLDLGFPGLRLTSSSGVTGGVSLDATLAFGIDRDLGFYIPTGRSNKELSVSVTGSLPANTDDAKPDLQGQLAFLPIEIRDNHVGPDVTAGLGIDITTKRADGRLPLQDLGAIDFTPTIAAEGHLNLGLATTKSADMPSSLPLVKADLKIDGGVSFGAGDTKPQTSFGITFDNVAVDAGSLVRDFIKPVARELRKFTKPLEPAVNAINKPVPGLKELAAVAKVEAPTWYKLFAEVDKVVNPNGPSGLQVVDRVSQLVKTVQALDTSDDGSGFLPIGSFTVLPDVAASPLPVSDGGKLLGSSNPAPGDLLSKTNFAAKDAVTAATTNGGLSFPAIKDPKLFFQLLLGKDVPLVYFDAGRLAIERGMQFSYPLGPARLYIGGSARVEGHFAAGFDTYGLRKAYEMLTDKDTSNDGAWDLTKGLLQSFYIDDNDQFGNDVPEITFAAELTAGAAIGIPGFEAGAEGGINGQIDFNLHTAPEQDGKVRYPDIVKQWKVNKNPICFFDASAKIDAFIRAYVDTPIGKATFPIASGTVWKQDNLLGKYCANPPEQDPDKLAEQDGDELTILGTPEGQDIRVTQDARTVTVEGNGHSESYDDVEKIRADLKGGDDHLEIVRGDEGTKDAVFDITVCGGAGNDNIVSAIGPSVVYGDAGGDCEPIPNSDDNGSDTITGSPYADTLRGGAGDDVLVGSYSKDLLFGEAGDDVLRGGTGDDQLDGGDGTDTTDYSDHPQSVTVKASGEGGTGDEKDANTAVENVVGSPVNDTITAPGGSGYLDGSGGNDTITGGTGLMIASGGWGNDTFYGGTGIETIVGGIGADTLYDGAGSQTFYGGGDAGDVADYSKATGRVQVTLDGEANDGVISAAGTASDNIAEVNTVIGGKYDDNLQGNSAANVLRGGAGNDYLGGSGGNDKLMGEAGDDTIDGGFGTDDFVGGDGNDTADYSSRKDDIGLDLSLDGLANDGYHYPFSSYYENDNIRTDVENLTGSQMADHIGGSTGDNILDGGPGADSITGLAPKLDDPKLTGGNDTFIGGEGGDALYDVHGWSQESATADGIGAAAGADKFYGGEGQDGINANSGNDTVDGGTERDTVYGGEGDDTIRGGDGNDDLSGDNGNDTIDGEDGPDRILGNAGDDKLYGGDKETQVGTGQIYGGLGNDTIRAGKSGDNIETGPWFYERVAEDTGPNTVHGGPGEDHVIGSAGPDTIDTGEGNDVVESQGGNDVVDLGNGYNVATGGAGNDTITGGDGIDQISGDSSNAPTDGDDTIRGGAGDDRIYGDGGNDKLYGEAGNDFGFFVNVGGIYGGPGNDTIDGGTGADVMRGDDGFDTVTYADRTEKINIDSNGYTDGGASDQCSSDTCKNAGGRDTVDDSDVEKLVTGSNDDTVRADYPGHKAPLTVDAGAGNDTLTATDDFPAPVTFRGGDGIDTLTGGRFADSLDGGNDADVEKGGAGADVFAQGTQANGGDDLDGGADSDTVDYGKRPAGSAFVSLDNVANDGAAGEKDNVRNSVEKSLGAGKATAPTLSVAAVAVTEGNSGTTPAAFAAKLSQPAAGDVTATWTVTGKTATAGEDFTAASGSVTIPAGSTSATFTVAVRGDTTVEPDETAVVTLSAATGAVLATDPTATLTIRNDDAAPVTVSVAPKQVTEGNANTSVGFTATLSAAATQPVTVPWTLVGGTAELGKDVLDQPGSVTIPVGATTATLPVTVVGDALDETDETATVELGAVVNATATTPTALLTIADDDAAPSVSVTGAGVNEGATGTTTAMRFTVRLSTASGKTVSVKAATANGSATAGTDYDTASETITFAPGETTKVFTVTVRGDNAKESDETLAALLSDAVDAAISTPKTVGVIRNDD